LDYLCFTSYVGPTISVAEPSYHASQPHSRHVIKGPIKWRMLIFRNNQHRAYQHTQIKAMAV
jgi:hypothetical protein